MILTRKGGVSHVTIAPATVVSSSTKTENFVAMTDRSQTTQIEDAIEAGIEAASEYVSNLPSGQKAWGMKEFEIARTAAREAVAALRQIEAGK